MIKVNNLIETIENVAPLNYQEDYDNSGLQIGDVNADVKGVYIAVNVDLDVINDAIKHNCNVILVHHPLLFNPLKVIDYNTYQGRVIKALVSSDMVVYASHTAFDNTNILATQNLSKLGCKNILTIGSVTYGEIDATVQQIANRLASFTGDKNILITNKDKKVKKVAHINGSGGRMDEILPQLMLNNADAYISSEFKYSFVLDLINNGIEAIELNHFNSERIFIEIMNDICKNFDNVVMSTINQNPYNKE